MNKLLPATVVATPNRLPVLFNTLKLVLPGDYGAGIIANGQTGSATLKIALEFNYHRNKGGCIYSIPCCVTHYGEVPNSHRDGVNSIPWRDNGPGNKSLGGKLRGTSKIIDSDARARLGLRIGKGHQDQQ